MFNEGLPRHLVKDTAKPESQDEEISINNQLNYLVKLRDRLLINRYNPDGLQILVQDLLSEPKPTIGEIFEVSTKIFETVETAIEDSIKPH